MAKTCLLIAERFEPTADLLVAEMRRRAVPCVRWNLDRYPDGSALTFRASGQGFAAEIESDGRRLDLAETGSIWCRAFKPLGFPEKFPPADRKFAETEAERALATLFSFNDPVWVNHPQRHIAANSKAAQLRMAQSLGLEIPHSLITNDPDEVRAFAAQAKGRLIYKAHSQNLDMEPGKALYTGLLTEKELAHIERICPSPGVFQEFVEKDYEVRATVVGGRMFSARIDSQSRAASRIDWRHLPYEADSAIELPRAVEDKIHAFMKAFGLLYGAFDFIVTPDGRHVFLEVNPGGQYMWIESKLKLPITAALADLLADACRPASD